MKEFGYTKQDNGINIVMLPENYGFVSGVMRLTTFLFVEILDTLLISMVYHGKVISFQITI